MTVRIGTSGWSYRHWRGSFYPDGLSPKRELEYAAQQFSSLEVNRSFYSLLTSRACEAWRTATPRGFVFALKGSRFITHAKKLRDVQQSLANFFASGPLALGEKLGPIVWQLPAQLAFDEARLEAFFAALPRTRRQACALAASHDARVKQPFVEVTRDGKLRHAIEPRHESFGAPAFAALARRFGIAVAVSDSATFPRFELATADFMYLRLHGAEQTYASAYGERALRPWAAKIRAFLQGARRRDVYVYFDNDMHGHAPRDARLLAALIGEERAQTDGLSPSAG
jgi:uncharacterized protein YecE (DUF72 family)